MQMCCSLQSIAPPSAQSLTCVPGSPLEQMLALKRNRIFSMHWPYHRRATVAASHRVLIAQKRSCLAIGFRGLACPTQQMPESSIVLYSAQKSFERSNEFAVLTTASTLVWCRTQYSTCILTRFSRLGWLEFWHNDGCYVMPWLHNADRFQPESELQNSQPDRDNGGNHTGRHSGCREDKIQDRLLPEDLDLPASRSPMSYVYFCTMLLRVLDSSAFRWQLLGELILISLPKSTGWPGPQSGLLWT